MIKIVATVLVWGLMTIQTATAKPRYTYAPVQDRHALEVSAFQAAPRAYRTLAGNKKTKIANKARRKHQAKKPSIRSVIVAHPAGCPRARFCGCGVSQKVYGKNVRSLYLAANWLRFPRAAPAPGMVAARRGHVFYIIRVVGNGKVLAYDPNSGKRKTRIHIRSLAGFTVVNPRVAKLAAL